MNDRRPCKLRAFLHSLIALLLIAASSVVHGASETSSDHGKWLFEAREARGSGNYLLTLSACGSFVDRLLLENAFDWRSHQGTSAVTATDSRREHLFWSNDLGEHWTEVEVTSTDRPHRWRIAFTTMRGTHLVWNDATQQVHRFSPDWKTEGIVSIGDYPWHGSWSIGQQGDVIMFGEYAFAAERLHVWRSTDDGVSWSQALSLSGTGSENPEIRHFHVVQPDPYYPGSWYAESGDRAEHSRIWRSADNGLSWREVTPPSLRGTPQQSLLRFTAMAFDRDYIYWGTDDTLDNRDFSSNSAMSGHARFVRAKRADDYLDVESIGELASRPIRTLTVTDEGFVFISESRGPGSKAEAFLSADKVHIMRLADLPIENRRDGFVFSLGSIKARDGGFLTFGMSDELALRRTEEHAPQDQAALSGACGASELPSGILGWRVQQH